jgi:hypothetical protein
MRLLRLSIATALAAGIATFFMKALLRERERVAAGEADAANARSSIDDVPTPRPITAVPARTVAAETQDQLDERVAPGAPL